MTVELTEEEGELLTQALGTATAAALLNKNPKLATALLNLANAVNRNDPNWRSYVVPKGWEKRL